ncbi:hypothetical protein E3N88_37573 [Mikania micrantha]|uniref:Uncharacterized protein n=1 Tax=Mikania micrantha TaxID=192012 RepID=A0A5N6LRH0_9ASTR|nr:hypothetical protein E3N88_37573 [Mikania micrantha]
MARREGQYFPVCRIADGGNNSGVFHSRAREEDQSSTYRIANRGSGEVGLDPQDLKINRISPTWKETELEEPVWDESTGDEENSTHGGFIYLSPPCYDKHDDEEVNKEDCRRNAKALNEVDSQVGQPLWGSDETMGDELVSKICNVENIEGSDPKVVIGGPTAQSQSKVIPSFMPKDTPELFVRPRFTDFQKEDNLIKSSTLEDTQKESDIQLEENILISRNTDQFADNYVCMTLVHKNITRRLYNHKKKSSCQHEEIRGLHVRTYQNPHNSLEDGLCHIGDQKATNKDGPRTNKTFVLAFNGCELFDETFSLEGLDVDLYVGADGSIKFLKQFNNYAHKTRGRVFFEDGENDAGDDPRNNPDPEWDPD